MQICKLDFEIHLNLLIRKPLAAISVGGRVGLRCYMPLFLVSSQRTEEEGGERLHTSAVCSLPVHANHVLFVLAPS